MAHCITGQVSACPRVGGGTGTPTCNACGAFGACTCPGADGGDVTPPHDTGTVDTGTVEDVQQPVDTVVPGDASDGSTIDSFVPDSGPADTGPIDTGVVFDTGPADTGSTRSPLFGSCTTSTDCNTGFTCSTLFPGGLCTRACTTDIQCGTGVCDTVFGCLPRCSPHGGLECDRYGSACYPLDEAGTEYVCFPSCFPAGTTPPAGYTNTCIGGTTCDPNLEYCAPMLATGAGVGAPCTADGDCASGRCIAELDGMGQPTGYIGGQCYSIGRLPNTADYATGGPLPRANCPMNSVAIPFASGDEEGDPAICLRSCTTDSDCGRAGYFCDHFGTPDMPTFTTGICNPINCAMPAYACPTGYHCVITPTDAATPSGLCVAG
jgi:hypothetical protein